MEPASGSLSSFLIDSILSASPAFYANVSGPSETPQVMDLRVHHHLPASQTFSSIQNNQQQQQSHPMLHSKPLPNPPNLRKQPQPLRAPSARQERRRNRTMFSEWQLANLEWRFARNKYLTTNDRLRIAKTLRLDQLQVKTWFQNRRMKWKKQILASGIQKSPTKPKGRPRRDSIPPIDDRLLPSS